MRLLKGILIGLGITLKVAAQSNLVPNPSFEEYTSCPDVSGGLWSVEPWMHTGSVDYYHECGTNGAGIPISWGGGIC